MTSIPDIKCLNCRGKKRRNEKKREKKRQMTSAAPKNPDKAIIIRVVRSWKRRLGWVDKEMN
jgi:hypothetical protein